MAWIRVNPNNDIKRAEVIRADSIIGLDIISELKSERNWIYQINVKAICPMGGGIIFTTFEKTMDVTADITNYGDIENSKKICETLKEEILNKIVETVDKISNKEIKSKSGTIFDLNKLLEAKNWPGPRIEI